MMNVSQFNVPVKLGSRRAVAGLGAACLFGGIAAATVAAPSALAQPEQCTASALSGTVSSVTAEARQYLADNPGANQAVTTAMNQPRPEAEANLRGYFNANPAQYYDLRGILAPLGDAQRNCNVTVLPADLQSAYDTFMAG
ncbi:Haemophore haem-binding domain-containing protein [Mycobacterium sp. smrl_JER01]